MDNREIIYFINMREVHGGRNISFTFCNVVLDYRSKFR